MSLALRLIKSLLSIIVIVALSLLIATVLQGLAETAPSGKAVGTGTSPDERTQARVIRSR